MIFTVKRTELLEAVTRLQRVVGVKSSMPVLEGILMTAEAGKLTLVAYNLEMGMTKVLDAHCEEEGDIVLDARLMADILRKMRDDEVRFEISRRLSCKISCGESNFDIMGMAAVDFPELPILTDGNRIELPADAFEDMIKGTLFAAAQTEGSRPILTGVNVSVKAGLLQMVAIDGCRLAIRRRRVENVPDIGFIVPGRSLGEAVKLLCDDTDAVRLEVGERMVAFEIEGYRFISRLLEGEFVNYEKIMPSGYQQCVVLNTADLIDILERVSLMINDFVTVPVRCRFEKDNVTFSANTSRGSGFDRMAVALEGEPLEIGVNSRMLLDIVRAVGESYVQVRFNGPNGGIVLVSPEQENDEYFYLIMPMRLKNN